MPRKKRAGTRTVRSRTAARSRLLASQRFGFTFEPLEIRQLLSGGLLGSYYNNMTLTGNPTNTRVDGPINFNWNETTPVPGVGPDAFSVRWSGQIQAPVTQTYSFTTISNDGVRLWVNGEELINHWNSHPADVDSGSITLIAGEHYNLEMDYFQNTGAGTAVLEWSGPGQTPQLITANYLSPQTASSAPNTPTQFSATVVSAGEIDLNWQDNSSGADGAIVQRSTDGTNFSTIADLGDNQSPYADTTVSAGSTYFYRVIDTGSAGQSASSAIVGPLITPGSSGVVVGTNGLLGVYYTSVNFTSPTPVVVVDPQIKFNWNSSSPAPGIGNSNYSVQWTGQLLAPVNGIYTLTTTTDDGVRMWLGSQEIINDFTDHPAATDSAQVSLTAGQEYNVVIQYFNDDAPGLVQLFWTVPGQAQTIIPTAQLSPAAIAIPAPIPAAPSGLTATASSNALAPSIALSWPTAPGATSYDIYRGTVSGGESTTPFQVGVTATNFTNTAITAGTKYFYEVTAANAAGQSGDSLEASATVLIPAPTAPASLTATASIGQVTLSWPAVAGANSYDIYRGTTGGGESATPLQTGITTANFTDIAVTASSSYFYEVTAVNNSGQSGDSPEASATVPMPIPAAPLSLTTIPFIGQIAMIWPAVATATSYNLYRGTSSGGESSTPFQTGLTGTNYIDRAVTKGTRYFYRLTAVNASGQSSPSPEVSATLPIPIPPAPVSLTATASAGQVVLSWSTVAAAASYNTYRGTISGGESTTPFQTGITATNFTDTTVAAGSSYFYEVAAVNITGQGGNSPEASAKTPASLPAPAAPASLTATPSTGQITLSWSAVAAASTYNIYRGTISGGESTTPYQTGITATNFTDTAVTAGSSYFYEVTAVNNNGQSGDSPEASAKTPAPILVPAAPASLTATPSTGQITLSWSTVASVSSYSIYRGTISGGESATPLQTGITTANFTDTAVTAGSSYFYEITAVNNSGQSGDSPEASAMVPSPIPATPAGVTAVANSPSSISVSWLDEAYEAGFQVLQSTDGVNYSAAGTTQTGVIGYLASGLSAGQTYYFEIVATNASGNSSASAPAHATTPTSTSGFYGLTATPQPNEVLLAWPAQFQATNYSIFRGTSSGGESGSPIQTGLGDAFADTTAVAGTNYYYTVRATLKSGQVVSSSEVSAKPLAPVPSAPVTLLASALPSGILLNWSAASGATSYDIFRGLSSGNEATTPYKTGLTATSFIDTAISGAGTYYYVVAGVNASGQGNASTEASGRAPGVVGLPAPTGLFATANSTSDITVSWQDVPGETGFEVLRSRDGVNFSQITTVAGGITNYADSGLNAATTYYYQIVALGANSASPVSVSTSAVTQAAFVYTNQPAPQPSDGFTNGDPSGLVTPTTTQPNNIFYVGMPVTFQLGSSAVSYQVRDYNGNLVDQGTANPTTTLKVTNPGWYKLYVYGNNTTAQYGNIVGTSTFVIFNNNPNFTQLTDLYDGGNYYFVDPAMTRVDPSINFNWTNTAPSPNMPLTEYGVAWTGQIQAQATQTYVFSTTSDDGVRLWVNGQEIINDWVAHGATNDFGSIALVAGQRYEIKMEYYQAQYAAQISLSWSSTTTPGVIIPPSVLYPTDSSTTPGGLTGNYYIGLTSSDPSEDTVVHDITGMGPERINITDPSNPTTAIASVEADIQADDALYVGKDAERPTGLLVSFTNGTGDLADIKTIVTALQGQVEYWEGQNEPDTGAFTGAGYVPVEAAFYNTIKSVNPNLQVLGPAAVSIVDDGAGLPWIQDFLSAGGGKYIDGLSFHGYNSNQGSLYQLRESLSGITSLLQQYGLGNLPLWQTEQGYPTAIYGSYQPQIQGQWTMLQEMVYEQFGIPKEHSILWYDDSHGYWAIPDFWQNDDGTLLPAAALMDNWSQELYGTTFTQAYNFGSANNLYIGNLFTGPGKSVAAFMSAGQSNGSITLNVQGGSSLQVVDAFGNSTTVPVVNGQVTLSVPEEPVYVQMAPGQTINVVQQNWGADLALQSGTNASYSGSSASNSGINQIINGVQENWYWNGVAPWGTINDTDQGANIQITLPQQETISNVTIFAMPPWQLAGTLMDFDLQYYNSSIAQWVTLDHVVKQADTFGVFTPVDRTTDDSFFDNQYIFQNAFSPVTTQQIRLVINSVSYGGGATQLVPESGGQASTTPTLTISEVEIFG